jgi:hypothetical protein
LKQTFPFLGNDSTFLIPKSALVNSTERIFVVRIKEGKAEWLDVKKGREDGHSVEIYGDLTNGDQLAAVASEEIRNGSLIGRTTNVKQ